MSGYPSPIYNSPTIVSGGTLVFESGATFDMMPGAVVIGGTVQHARVTLTSAQILAIAATPITVIPAPGGGNVITIVAWASAINFNSVAYSSTALNLYYTNASGTSLALGPNAALVSATVSSYQNGRGSVVGPVASSTVTNQPVVVSAASSPTAGNSTIDIDVWYTVGAQ